jgi:methylamine---glutamate N-methyltransferase subunit A
MCGIAGLLYKSPLARGPLGHDMLRMLDVLRSRGADSTGIALYGGVVDQADAWVSWINLNSAGDLDALAERVVAEARRFGDVANTTRSCSLLRLTFSGDREIDVDGLTRAIETVPGAEVFGVGRSMELVKDMGTADVLAERHAMSDFQGTHGLGHTRLATESIVDIAHSHPYWARPFRDIAVVHNGQLTNHHKLRRAFEARGYHFLTDNDSEVIAVYIASQLEEGATLQTALEHSVRDLDGTFTYLISTADGIGFAKDRYASKPLIVAETPEFVALASEEVALGPVLTADAEIWEPEARTVRTWSR